MSTTNDWVNFWKISAESANESLRMGEILPETNEIKTGTIFSQTFQKYINFLKIMDNEMQKNTLNKKSVFYRNIHIDIYSDLEIGETLYHPCFLSCFKDKNDNTFGNIKLTIIIHENSPFLEYDNVIILPTGHYKLLEKGNNSYTIELIESFRLFQS